MSTEPQLLIQAREGDKHAFQTLYHQLEPAVRRFINRLIGYGQEAEDVVQDTMIAFYRNMHRIDPPDKLRPYIYRIARNRCYDELRWQGRYDRVALDDDAVQLRVSFDLAKRQGQTPEDITHWVLLSVEVREAMDLLPEAQRQALILYSEEGFTYAEIADIMNVSIGTIKSRIFHAKKGLRRLLKPETLAYLEAN